MKINQKRLALYMSSFLAGSITARVYDHWFGSWLGMAMVSLICLVSSFFFERLLNRWWVER